MFIPTTQLTQGSDNLGLLYDTILGADGSFDVPSISQAYKHLLLVYQGRAVDSGGTIGLKLRLNNDSGSNYDHTWLYLNSGGAPNKVRGDRADVLLHHGRHGRIRSIGRRVWGADLDSALYGYDVPQEHRAQRRVYDDRSPCRRPLGVDCRRQPRADIRRNRRPTGRVKSVDLRDGVRRPLR